MDSKLTAYFDQVENKYKRFGKTAQPFLVSMKSKFIFITSEVSCFRANGASIGILHDP